MVDPVMVQLLQVIGAVLLLSGFAAAQLGVVKGDSLVYLAANTVGAADLAILALVAHDWGFTLLEGTWAVISFVGVLRQLVLTSLSRRSGSDSLPHRSLTRWSPLAPAPAIRDPLPGPWQGHRNRPRGAWVLPEQRRVQFTGDELAEPGRLVRLFRDSYTASQGRQWVQAHVLWWISMFVRGHGVQPDWDVLKAQQMVHTAATMGLPPGHMQVHPPDQVSMNFRLWWPILTDLARAADRRRWPRGWPGEGITLPGVEQLEDRAYRLGLRPWMSSATAEELAGIGKALALIDSDIRRGRTDADDFMIRVLLPELLIVELRWLHTPGGRPREGNPAKVDVVLLRQYKHARGNYSEGRYLTPLNHMYLRAGDILEYLSSLPDEAADPYLQRVVALYRELQAAVQTLESNEALSERH